MSRIIQFLTDTEFLGIEAWRYGLLLLAIFVGLAAGRLVRYFMERAGKRLKRRKEESVAGLILECLGKPASFFCFVIGLQLGFMALGRVDERVIGLTEVVLRVLYAMALGYAIYRLVDIVDHYLLSWAGKTPNKIDDMLVPLVRKSLRVTIVVIIALFIVESLYKGKMTTLLASLGVGGLAVALAAQDTIKNFFGSVMILMDKPFQVGDRVVIGEHDGPVEEVGFRTTKVRTLDGHLVTIPNSTVVNEMVRNIGRRPYIRRLANITITYDTPPEKVRRAVEIIQEVLDNHEGMDPEFPPRVYFNDFNDWALNLLVIYWYHPPEYWDYLAFTQRVNLEIFERFNAEGIEFAFPTQTVYLANAEKRHIALKLLSEQAKEIG